MAGELDLINRPMAETDVSWALNHNLTKELRDFVDSCTKNDVPFWNGNLRNNTFITAGNRFKTFNWYRLWEYVSCYEIFIKRYPVGAHFIDLGGAGCYFSYYLAANGYKITVIDTDTYLIDLSNAIAKKLSLTNNISCVRQDINENPGPRDVDGLYSISVIEHIPEDSRIKTYQSIHTILGGTKGRAFLTFDFGDFSASWGQAISSLSRLSTDLQSAGFILEGNPFHSDMEQQRRKPYGTFFNTVYSRIATLSPTDPISSQLSFLLKSLAIRMKFPEARAVLRKLIKRTAAPDYNFCRLLIRPK